MYETKILLDSISPAGARVTTFELTYPRFVHAELMTHRVFSRCSASSRAIPVERLIERVDRHPVLPKWWGKNQKGMQAREELSPAEIEVVKRLWLEGKDAALALADRLSTAGLHKQIANRPLEAWMFITVIVTSTDYRNWFRLRHHEDAQPEIAWVATDMLPAYLASVPRPLAAGEWHLPLLPDHAQLVEEGYTIAQLKAISAGRVARVSYLTHDGVRDPLKDIELGLGLGTREPPHMSPLEHVAQSCSHAQWNALVYGEMDRADRAGELFNPMRLGNLVGWRQFRKEFSNESGFDATLPLPGSLGA